MNLFVVLLLLLIAGFAPILYKKFLSGIDFKTLIVIIAAVNFIAATFLYITNMDSVNADIQGMSTQTMVLLALLIIVTYFIGQLLYMNLLQNNASYAVSSIVSIAPVITLIASVFIFDQKVGIPGTLGVLLTSLGVGAILLNNMNPK